MSNEENGYCGLWNAPTKLMEIIQPYLNSLIAQPSKIYDVDDPNKKAIMNNLNMLNQWDYSSAEEMYKEISATFSGEWLPVLNQPGAAWNPNES